MIERWIKATFEFVPFAVVVMIVTVIGRQISIYKQADRQIYKK